MKHYILITGAMRTGKDTFASFLTSKWPEYFARISLADELKSKELELRRVYWEFIQAQLGTIGRCCLDNATDKVMQGKNGVALQKLGTEWARTLDPLAWVKALKSRAEKESRPYVIVPDCRFENEFYARELLPGTRVVIYANEPTIRARLLEVNDTRRLWEHESEHFAHRVYHQLEKSHRIPAEFEGADVFDTSTSTGVDLGLYRELVEVWGRGFLTREGWKG